MPNRQETPPVNPVEPPTRLWVERAVREIQNGDMDRFEEVFNAYFPICLRYFLHRGCSDDRARDLAQDALLRVYTGIAGFRGESSFDTWFFRLLGNLWKNELRHVHETAQGQAEKNAVAIPPTGWQDEEETGMSRPKEPVDSAPDPLEQALEGELEREKVRRLDEALEQLPARMRQCFHFRKQGLPYGDIAKMMNVTTDTVKKQLSAAKHRLRVLVGTAIQLLGVFLFGG